MTGIDMSLDDIITKSKQSRGNNSRRGSSKGKQVNRAAPYALPRKPTAVPKISADKIVVSNLAFSVTEKDVKELFSQIGETGLTLQGSLKSAQLNYNSEGKSKGVATVVFNKSGDAARAVKEYNNRAFDGRPMKIELIVAPDALVAPVSAVSRLGAPVNKVAKVANVRGVASARGRGGARRGRGRDGRAPKKPANAEDLDAELDGYMNDQAMEDATGVSHELSNAL